MSADAGAEAEIQALTAALEAADDPAGRERLAVVLAELGRAEAALDQLAAVIPRLPQRAKGWRAVAACLKALPAPQARAQIWRACLAVWTDLEAADAKAGEAFGEDLAGRLFPYLAETVQLLAPADPAGIAAAWRLAGALYADPAFAELAARFADRFDAFVRVAGEDRYWKEAENLGADLSPCVLDALELHAPPGRRQALAARCRSQMASRHGGLEAAQTLAAQLVADPAFHRPVIICGFHHSGTRLLARQLAGLGVEQRINTFQYEWTCANQLNCILEPGCMDPGRLGAGGAVDPRLLSPDRLAFRMGLAGLRPGETWGFKDPRNGLTALQWLQAFPHARIVHLLRDPVAALGSLPDVYDQFVRTDAARPTPVQFWIDLWEAYVAGARRGMAASEAAIEIRFEDLCRDPAGVLTGVCETLDLGTEVGPALLQATLIEAGKSDLRGRLRAELPPADFGALEALATRYGY